MRHPDYDYRRIVADIKDVAIIFLDMEGNVQTWNKGAEKIKGYTAEEIIGNNSSIFYSEDDRKQLLPQKLLKEAAQNGSAQYEGWRLRKDGTRFWGNVVATAICDESSHITGFSKVTYDLTEKKQAEDALKAKNRECEEKVIANTKEIRNSELKFRALIENSTDLLSLYDKDGYLVYCSPAVEKVSGYSIDELRHKSAEDYIHPDNIGWAQMAFTTVKSIPGIPTPFLISQKNKSGSRLWLEGTVTNLLDDPSVGAIVCHSRDITERKEAEEQLKNSYREIEQLFDNTDELFLVLDSALNIVSFNKNTATSTKKLLGLDIEKGMSVFKMADPNRVADLAILYDEVLAGATKETEIELTAPNGEGLNFLNIIRPLSNKNGEIDGIFITIRNVTEKVKYQKQREFDHSNLTALINNTDDLMWSVDRNYNLITSNEAFDRLVTIMSGGAIAKGENTLSAGFTDEQLIRWRGLYDRALAGEIFKVVEHTEQPSEFWSEVSFHPIYSGGMVIGTACYSHNITEQAKTDKQLRSSEHRFRAMIENGADSISLMDENGALTYFSNSTLNLMGYTQEELQEMPVADMLHADDSELFTQLYKDVMGSPGTPFFATFRVRHKTKKWIWVEGTMTNMLHDEHIRAIISNFRDITERKNAKERLLHANRLYAFISQINQMIVHVDSEKLVLNEACRIAVGTGKFKIAWIGIIDTETATISLCAESGLPAEDLAQLTNVSYQHGGPTDHVIRTNDFYICNNVAADLELVGWGDYAALNNIASCMALPIRKSGKIIGTYNLYSVEKEFFNHDEIGLLKEIAEDISFALDILENEQRKRAAEEQLKHSELKLKQAQSIAHIGSWEINLSTGIASWSDEACNIFGVAPNDNKHNFDTWLSFIHPDDLALVLRATGTLNTTLSSTAFYHRIKLRSGVVKYIYSQAQYELSPDGKPVGLSGVVHDITDTVKAEEAMRQSEANLRLIMDLIPQSIFAKNIEGYYIFANKSFAALYGLTPLELINRPLTETIPKNNRPSTFLEQDRRVIETGQTEVIPEMHFTDHTGVRRTFHTTKVPYRDAVNNEKAVLGIALDITDQKQAEAERAKMTADILQRNKDLEQFSYIVSHNLRSPVANIIGVADLLRHGDLDQDEEKEMMDGLFTSVQKLDNVIKDLNEVLQLKQHVSENREPVSFSRLVEDIKFSIQKKIIDNEVEIIADFSETDEFTGIKSYLYSIFFNLITNSIKYRQPGVRPVISITSHLTEHATELVFKDNGMGIDMVRNKEQIFGLYRRFHHHTEGKGMGLYMVKSQVETMAGKISISSEINKGTQFTIIFEHTS